MDCGKLSLVSPVGWSAGDWGSSGHMTSQIQPYSNPAFSQALQRPHTTLTFRSWFERGCGINISVRNHTRVWTFPCNDSTPLHTAWGRTSGYFKCSGQFTLNRILNNLKTNETVFQRGNKSLGLHFQKFKVNVIQNKWIFKSEPIQTTWP